MYIMNYTHLNDAFRIHHANPNTYGGNIQYSTTCIYCQNPSSKSLMNDGGAFRQCQRCRRNFMATIMNEPIRNFTVSTNHLKGTN